MLVLFMNVIRHSTPTIYVNELNLRKKFKCYNFKELKYILKVIYLMSHKPTFFLGASIMKSVETISFFLENCGFYIFTSFCHPALPGV